VFSFAVKPGIPGQQPWLVASPMDQVARTPAPGRKKPRVFKADELRALLTTALARERYLAEVLKRLPADGRRRLFELTAADAKRDRVWFTVLAFTGLRFGEAARMRWKWIDIEDRLLWVQLAKTGELLPSQEIPLAQRAADALKDLGLREPEDLVFPGWARTGEGAGPRGTRAATQELTSMAEPLRRLCALAGVEPKGVGQHTFRHTFKSLLARAGVLESVSEALMRHSSGTMAQRYTHAEVEDQREALERLEVAVFPPPLRLVRATDEPDEQAA
jgi:integrase